MERMPRRGRLGGGRLYLFEKWYFDGQSDDGAFFFAYLAPSTWLGRTSAELVVGLFPPGGGEQRRALHLRGDQLTLRPDRAGASFRGGELSLGAERCRLRVDAGGIELDVRYTELDPPWAAGGDGVLLRPGAGEALRWVVPLPRGRLRGSVRVDGASEAFDGGLGYSDFVQSNVAPWKLPLRELLWGRALSPTCAVVWNQLGFGPTRKVAPDRVVGAGLLRRQGAEPLEAAVLIPRFGRLQDHPRTRDRYPLEMELGYGADTPPVIVDQTRLLLGEFVIDVQDISSPLVRWLYRTFTGDPVEYKLLSRARVGGAEALAAHEWVRWGRNRGVTRRD